MSATEVAQWVVRILLAALFVGMGVAHFLPGPARGMGAIIPPSVKRLGIPTRAIVAITGVFEVAGGVGLLVEPVRFAAGLCLVVFLVAVFPANSYASQHPERFGRAAIPYWPRFAAQLALIALVMLAVV